MTLRFHFILLFLGTFCVASLVGQEGEIMTINGPIQPSEMGKTLIHEHVFLDWSGADRIDPKNWNSDEAYEVILPFLLEVKKHGVTTFMECTPTYLGKNVPLLKRLADATKLQIITNTGFYAARKHQYLPEKVQRLRASEIASIWIDDWRNGIDDSGVRPGFIKIGVDSKPDLESVDTKIVRAAAQTHLATGLTIVAHTGDDTTAFQQLKIIESEGVSPEAFVWTHAQRGTTHGHIRAARAGTWISLDGLGWARPTPGNLQELEKYAGFLLALKEHQLLHKVLISHDAGWYTVGEESQGSYRGYTLIFEILIPYLNRLGFEESDWQQLLIDNPQAAYQIRVRKI